MCPSGQDCQASRGTRTCSLYMLKSARKDMDYSFTSHVHHADLHHTQNTKQTPPHTQRPPSARSTDHQARPQLQQHQLQLQLPLQPPLKRRRANSGKSSVTTPTEPVAHHQQPSNPSEPWQTLHTRAVKQLDRAAGSFVPRNPSPDRVSRVSATSSLQTGGPQLRKKPKTSFVKDTTKQPTTPAVPNSLSVSAPHTSTPSDPQSVYIVTNNHNSGGSSVSRTNSGTSQHLSPNQKRAPASHSSYGVETTCGPPPSYSTQRTFSQERIRKLDRSAPSRMQTTSDPAYINAFDEASDTFGTSKKEGAASLNHSSPDTTDTQSIPTPTETEAMSNVKIRGDNGTSTEEEGKASSSDERRSEDLFLNIAQTDAARPSYSKSDKRRSRISIPFMSNSRPVQAARSSPVQASFDSNTITSPRSEVRQYHSKRASLGGQISGASLSRTYLVDNNRVREPLNDLSSDNERIEIINHGRLPRRSSMANTESTKLAHRSSAGLRSNRMVSESVYQDAPRAEEQIATESTISTTAPSTVWDELDDLKSRIRKLELTGKLPSSSAAAMGSNERPRTATTAATTMSASPKYKASEPNLQSAMEGVPQNLHPLLHEALGNASSVVSPDVYQKLYATAQDALQLATMINTDGQGARHYSATLSTDRQIQRRTESMCRSLTELAIALAAEAKPVQVAIRPASRDQSLPPNSMLRSRRYSNDPTDRGPPSARVQSRIESRRTSVHLTQEPMRNMSPEHVPVQSPNAYMPMSDPRLNRTSTLLRKHGQSSFDGVDDQFDSPSIRPASRAMTELGAYRRIPRDQFQPQREYTSQHPLPNRTEQPTTTNTPLSSSASTNFTSRRKFTSPASVIGIPDNAPSTPREAWGRISIVASETQTPEAAASEVGSSGRVGSTRRSLGFASRIGSSVGSRLRAVRAERSSKENVDMREGGNEMAPSGHGNENMTGGAIELHRNNTATHA